MIGLTREQLQAISQVLRRHPEVTRAILYGSRAKGCHREHSDIDLALEGIDSELKAETIRGDLESCPLPQHFDVCALNRISCKELREHVNRVGVVVYDRDQ